MASDALSQAPPSATISKKKRRSEKFVSNYNKTASKKACTSEKALIAVQTLPEKQYDFEGKVINHESNFATKGENQYYANQWDEFIKLNPEAAHEPDEYEEFFGEPDLATVGQWRGMPVTQKVSGARRDCHREIRDKMGDPTGRIRVGSNQSVGWKRESAKKRKGTWDYRKSKPKKIGEDEAIIDADFEDVKDSPQFRKANKDARDLGLPKRSKRASQHLVECEHKEEPAAMRAVNDRKRSVVNKINDIAKPSTKRKPSLVKHRDLVDEAFYGLVDVGKCVGKIGKTITKAGRTGIGAGFQVLDQGAKAFSESTIGTNIRNQANTDYKHMRSQGFRAAESIKATGQKKLIREGSLVTQGTVNQRGYSTGSSSKQTVHGFSARYVKGHRGHIALQWTYKGEPVEFAEVKDYLTNNEINQLRKGANSIFKGHISLSSSNKGSIPTVNGKSGYGLVNNTKKATLGRLTKQRNPGVSHSTDYDYEPAYGNNQAIGDANKTGGLFTTKTKAFGLALMKTNSDVVVSEKTGNVKTTKIATPSGLVGRNKVKGHVNKTKPATPSKILGKAANAGKTTTVGLATRRDGEIGTTHTQNGIISSPKPITLSSIITSIRHAGGTCA